MSTSTAAIVAELITRMSRPRPGDADLMVAPVDLSGLDAAAIGDLWVVAQTIEMRDDKQITIASLAVETARAVFDQAGKTKPVFQGPACRDYLDSLARELEAKAQADIEKTRGFYASFPWSRAAFVLTRCTELSFAGFGDAARRFLAATDWTAMPQLALVVARLVDATFAAAALDRLVRELAAVPLLVAEVRLLAALDLATNLAVADIAERHYREEDREANHRRLLAIPDYVAFAEMALRQAAAHARDLHAGTVPYAADKAFMRDETPVLDRCARVSLDRDEPWAPAVLDELLRKVSVAPTAAKTVPSQSVAIALGHAIEAFPTPETVETLRAVLRDIRHDGVKKKLQRNLRGAERGLAGRPEIALRLPLDRELSKSQLTTLTRCLEAGFALRMELPFDEWHARLASHPQIRPLTASLVWRLLIADGSENAVLPVLEGGQLELRDVSGASITPPAGCRVMLWHPSDAPAAEHDAWRDRIATLRMRQPFKQVFREYYTPAPAELAQSETAMFAGHVASVVPLLGLARRERWHIDDDSLVRRFGRWTARLDLGNHIYPGHGGGATTRNLHISTDDSGVSRRADLQEVPAATLSEILRAVDLLVSASGFGVSDDPHRHYEPRLCNLAEGPLAPMAEMRKQALARALRGVDGMTALTFEARHLRLGAYAIHLSTGRVTRDGEPIEIDPPKKPSNLVPIPWLPYDEKLLETIFYATVEIAQRAKAERPHAFHGHVNGSGGPFSSPS